MSSEHEITDGHTGASTGGARARAAQWTEPDIVGLKYFDPLLPLLERLKDDGSARDRAGNIEQHCDQYCLLVLLYLFNPIC